MTAGNSLFKIFILNNNNKMYSSVVRVGYRGHLLRLARSRPVTSLGSINEMLFSARTTHLLFWILWNMRNLSTNSEILRNIFEKAPLLSIAPGSVIFSYNSENKINNISTMKKFYFQFWCCISWNWFYMKLDIVVVHIHIRLHDFLK